MTSASVVAAPGRTGNPGTGAGRRGTAHRPAGALSLSQARRVALHAQGLDRPRAIRSGAATMRQLQQVVDRLGLLQIDSVNVVARAHLMPTFSRVGPYDTALLDRASGRAPRRLVETWAHEASYVSPETYALLGWRRRAYEEYAWGSIREVPLRHSPLVAEVLAMIAGDGPLTASEVHARVEGDLPRSRPEWGWNWTAAKRVLEYLFFTGQVASARRNPQFERCYDLTERVLPPHVLAAPEPDEADAVRALLEIAARAHGVASERCLLDYFRIKGPRARQGVQSLVEDGTLVPVRVEGWERPVYLHAGADLPRRATGRALLSPFDPLVFERRRLEELFGLRYRIEIYVPEPLRVHGYYVLPFLRGEGLAALVDLKADRRAGLLRVHAAHVPEPAGPAPRGADDGPVAVAEDLAAELRLLAEWLGLDDVVVGDKEGAPRGTLAPVLAAALAAA
jgi:uncharacterized protein YcaQ